MKVIYPVLAAFAIYLYFGYKIMFFLCSERVNEYLIEVENQIINI